VDYKVGWIGVMSFTQFCDRYWVVGCSDRRWRQEKPVKDRTDGVFQLCN